MRIENIGTVIAERELDGLEDGKPCKITIKFGKPVQLQDDGSWYCPYSITTSNAERLFSGAGLDSLQALRIAISMAGAELATQYPSLQLRWSGDDDLGFGSQL